VTTEANEGIGQAIEKWVDSLPSIDGRSPGILGDWICVAAMVAVDDEGDPRVEYYLALKNGTMLPHLATGLLHEGLALIRGGRVGHDDD
jgi:hypothetical protein